MVEAGYRKRPLVPRKYEFIEHTADLGFRCFGATLEELFTHAGLAFFEALVNLETIEKRIEKTIEAEADALDELMVNWLDELLFMYDTEGYLFSQFHFEMIEENQLKARASGEILDLERHDVRTGIKAVTYHQLSVVKKERRWEAQVIFDI
jgi:SHS2 domain-containing protein